MSFDLEIGGRRALVTGGTKGVGAAVVEVLRKNGVTIATTARSVRHTRQMACTISRQMSAQLRAVLV